MAFNVKNLTNKGRNLQAKAQAGAELKYTKFVFGDGVLGSQSIPLLTNVISPKKTELVSRVFVVPTDQRANVGMYFTNADVTTGFIWRELGIYALDPDEGEILYWYGYDSNGTEIPAGGGSEILEQTFDMLVYVGTAQNVSSTIDQSLVFATIEEMNQVLADSKAYTDTKFANATIPDASLTQKGKVQLTNAINSTSQSLVPTAKAVNDARQAAITDAAADATTKANAAEANAKGASLPRTGGSLSGPLKISSWGTLSAGSGGYFLVGQNCYMDASGTVYRFQNNHPTMGARGVVFRLGFEGAWFFDTGLIATTQDQTFTPTLKKIMNTDDYNAIMDDIIPILSSAVNLIPNSSALLGLSGWVHKTPLSYRWSATTGAAAIGGRYFINQSTMTINDSAILETEESIPVYAGKVYNLQAWFYSQPRVVVWDVTSSTPTVIATLVPLPVNEWYRRSIDFTIPEGVTNVKVTIEFRGPSTAGTYRGVTRIKLSYGPGETVYSNELDGLMISKFDKQKNLWGGV